MLSLKTKDCCNNPSCSCGDLQEAAEKAGRKVRETLSSVSHEAQEVTEKTLREIRHHPVQSSLIAAAAGFILASVLRRR